MTGYDPSVYDNEWLARRVRYHLEVSRITNRLIGEYGPFGTSLDLGAGDGRYSHTLAKSGTEAHAVDLHEWDLSQLPTKSVNCITHDLREPLDLGRRFDLVLCIEVAEHLPESAATVLCDTVARHCGGLLVFTAAPPGQGGDAHVNEQLWEYWHYLLTKRGLVYSPEKTAHISREWRTILEHRMWWLYTNVTIYEVGR